MNRQTFIHRPHMVMTAAERAAGRFMRAPDHPGGDGGGATQGAGGDNTGGNAGDSGTQGGNQDNNGQGFDAEAFWRGPAPENNGAPNSGESATGGNQGSGTQGQGGNQGQGDVGSALAAQLNTLNFGESLFDETVVREINEGNFQTFNTRVQSALQGAVRNSLMMNVQVMREYGNRLMQQVREEINGTLAGRDDQSQLVKDFPTAADPKVAPAIQQTYDQALKNTRGNRAEAVKQTKQMLAIMATITGADLDLDVAPRGQGDSRPASDSGINWLEELAGR